MSDLIKGHKADAGPVECLGQKFPSNQARREHYLKLLADKLQEVDVPGSGVGPQVRGKTRRVEPVGRNP